MNRVLYDSPLGIIALSFDGGFLTELCFQGDMSALLKISSQECASLSPESCSSSVLKLTVSWLDRYFQRKNPDVSELSIRPHGSDFALKVWDELIQVPYGSTLSYGQLAARIARRCGLERMSAQAVGHALAKNPLPIVIPCHRIISSDGSLGGYSAGLERKRFLLHLESQTQIF